MTTLLNLECSLDDSMLTIAESSASEAFCLVPENRLEISTEGGLDAIRETPRLGTRSRASRRRAAPSRSSSIPTPASWTRPPPSARRSWSCTAPTRAPRAPSAPPSWRLAEATAHARSIGLRVNAGHGLDFENVGPVAAIEGVEELNIGFAMVARAVFDGVDRCVTDMLRLIDGARP